MHDMEVFSGSLLREALPTWMPDVPISDLILPGNCSDDGIETWNLPHDESEEAWFTQFIDPERCAQVRLDPMPTDFSDPADISAQCSAPQPRTPKGKAKRYSKSQIQKLRKWVRSHVHDPYLTRSDREDLVSQTGLSKRQVANYVANFRRRELPRNDVLNTLSQMTGNSPPGAAIQCLINSAHESSVKATCDTKSDKKRPASPLSTLSFSEEPLGLDYHQHYAARARTKFAEFGGSILDWFLADSVHTQPEILDTQDMSPCSRLSSEHRVGANGHRSPQCIGPGYSSASRSNANAITASETSPPSSMFEDLPNFLAIPSVRKDRDQDMRSKICDQKPGPQVRRAVLALPAVTRHSALARVGEPIV